jgi:homoserine kinase type II
MSVFTTLSLEEVSVWLKDFSIGKLVKLKGIAAGITNTNYFVITDQQKYVLTIFEKHTADELPYFVSLMAHLANHGVPCPSPVLDKHGVALHLLKGKPALMVTCLNGEDVATPNLAQVKQVASTLAKMHLAGESFTETGSNQRGQHWFDSTAQMVMPKLDALDATLLSSELNYQKGLNVMDLPRGVIHGDLFRDNVLFDGDKLGGFIDFYYACNDILAYDVAIAMNEWCLHHNGSDLGSIDQEKANAFLAAYQALRPFTQQEHKLWLAMLRRAALRFWLSRLHDFYFPPEGELTYTKDPNHFKKLLQQYIHIADNLSI